MMVPALSFFYIFETRSFYCNPGQSQAHCAKQTDLEFSVILLPLLPES